MTVQRGSFAILLWALAASAAGCSAVVGLFKAGVWVGILAVVFVAFVVALTTGMFRRS